MCGAFLKGSVVLEFTCVHCKTVVAVYETFKAFEVVCPNCNVRQPVPADATTAKPRPQIHSIFPTSPASPMPDYLIALCLGITLIVIGILELLVAIVLALKEQSFPFSIVASGFVTSVTISAFGILLLLVRDITRNTVFLRNK